MSRGTENPTGHRVVNRSGTVVCERCLIADTSLTRLRGLLGRATLDRGEGLLIRPASSIHMAFMRFPIDAVFLNAELEVVSVWSDLRPWRVAGCRGAKSVLELAAGEAKRRGIEVGQRLAFGNALSDLVERIGAVLDRDSGHDSTWHEIEALLTEGYAHTLALESKRWRIERRLARRPRFRNLSGAAGVQSLTDRHLRLDGDIKWLRALLAELQDHGVVLRDEATSREAGADERRAA